MVQKQHKSLGAPMESAVPQMGQGQIHQPLPTRQRTKILRQTPISEVHKVCTKNSIIPLEPGQLPVSTF